MKPRAAIDTVARHEPDGGMAITNAEITKEKIQVKRLTILSLPFSTIGAHALLN